MALLASLALAATADTFTHVHTQTHTSVHTSVLNISTNSVSARGSPVLISSSLGMGVGEGLCCYFSDSTSSSFWSLSRADQHPSYVPSWQNLKCRFSVNAEIISGVWRRLLLQWKHVLDFFLPASPLIFTALGFTNPGCCLF